MSLCKEIDPQQARQLLESRSETLVIDLRDDHSFKLDRHPKAQRLDESTLKRLLKQGDRKTPIIVICYHGNSSRDISKMLSDFGFSDSYSLQGGYEAWKNFLNSNEINTPETLRSLAL